jgi:hypothetical protein
MRGGAGDCARQCALGNHACPAASALRLDTAEIQANRSEIAGSQYREHEGKPREGRVSSVSSPANRMPRVGAVNKIAERTNAGRKAVGLTVDLETLSWFHLSALRPSNWYVFRSYRKGMIKCAYEQ